MHLTPLPRTANERLLVPELYSAGVGASFGGQTHRPPTLQHELSLVRMNYHSTRFTYNTSKIPDSDPIFS